MSGQLHSPAGRLIPRKRASVTHCIGGWVGPKAFLDAVRASGTLFIRLFWKYPPSRHI